MQSSRIWTTGKVRQFLRSEDGSNTLEAVIWLPIFVTMLALVMNVTLVFFNESQMLRVVQDANRAFSLGRLGTTTQTEDYIAQKLAYLSNSVVVDTVLLDGVVTTNLTVPAADMMPMRLVAQAFSNTLISVSAQHIVEY